MPRLPARSSGNVAAALSRAGSPALMPARSGPGQDVGRLAAQPANEQSRTRLVVRRRRARPRAAQRLERGDQAPAQPTARPAQDRLDVARDAERRARRERDQAVRGPRRTRPTRPGRSGRDRGRAPVHRSTAQGLRTTNESGPASTRRPADLAGPELPAEARRASTSVTSTGAMPARRRPAGTRRPGRRCPRRRRRPARGRFTRRAPPRGGRARRRPASDERRVVVRHLGPGERIPASSAIPFASMSRSYRISRWSATNPAEHTTTAVRPSSPPSRITSSTGGPNHGSAVRPALCQPVVYALQARAAPRPGRPSPAARLVRARVRAQRRVLAPRRPVVDGAHRQAVRGEHDRAPVALLVRQRRRGRRDPLREERRRTPGGRGTPHERELDARRPRSATAARARST